MTEENPPKKMKTDENGDKETAAVTVHSTLNNLSGFKVTNILGDNCDRKTITLQGNFEGHEGTGIVLLEKKAFNREAIDGFFSEKAIIAKDFCNDIYGSYNAQAHGEFADIKTTIIHPATEKHIQKFSAQNIFIVNETAELYKNVCLPHLQKEYFSIDWVLNVLDHKAEADRVVFEDPDPEIGFILAPDLKWDCETRETLYVLAIVRKLNIVSIRDLTAEHLPLLRNVLEKGTAAIKEKYGLDSSELRIYFHYRPTFNHLHIHFTALKYDAPGCRVEKAHMLTSVISNIELVPDYYQRVSLPLVVRQAESLYAKLVEHGQYLVGKHRSFYKAAFCYNCSNIVALY
ncbi:hypothetical protein B566_EDAN001241 [Ephemera danica]|nr:hypothetical protein B566_EDAN001241 [Ephemera danica]